MNNNMRISLIITLVFMMFLIIINGCQKKAVNLNTLTPEEQLAHAKRIFEKKDYLKAKTQLTIIVLNNPGSQIIEEAQFYLGETYFYLKEYFQAIAEYEKLIRSLPSSVFVDDARYKIGMCYYKLAPGYSLDQEYRYKALTQFQLFLEEYPTSDLRSEVERRLSECREVLAKKEFKTGELYRRMGYYRAAIISFDIVLENYYETKYTPNALFLKGECYKKLEEWKESEQVYQAFLIRYPKNSLSIKVKDRLKEVRKKLTEG